MTYSIVARDDLTGELGVAVQTCMFAVGSLVPLPGAMAGEVTRLRADSARLLLLPRPGLKAGGR